MEKGDYVLALKWGDGDPQDHWFIGFYFGIIWNYRYDVRHEDGVTERPNGFRRVEKITKAEGFFLLHHRSIIEASGRSLLWWLGDIRGTISPSPSLMS